MFSTKTFSIINTTTLRTFFLSFMKNSMLRLIGQKQVLNSIIISNTIFMMDLFVFGKKPSEMFFHYKSVFSNIAKIIFERVEGIINKLIATTIEESSFPRWMVFTQYIFRVPFMFTFFRAKSTPSLFKPKSFYREFFTTEFTNKVGIVHNFILPEQLSGNSIAG